MALSPDQTAQIFEIFGIPQGGAGFGVYGIATLWGPFGEPFSFSALVTELNAKITAVTAEIQTRVTTQLVTWDEITASSPIVITKSSTGTEGTIVDHPRQREMIRQTIGSLIGFKIPYGGFTVEPREQGSNRISR